MCVGVPMRAMTVHADTLAALCTDGDREELIDLSLVGLVAPGTWMLTFLGAAREVITEDEATKIKAALDGLRSLMGGGALGDAFADLEETGPRLPPHLAAALPEGKTTA
ncbi:HypC/HybG/HupF family hydrogenase formation chaperone [uncultured Maritimibacter sp.]|uniref:HypC/HybG/HupF family hydrogenase formation chaperone n=1 Tax=uncultured Maritimibacter sp. TaxID=991866 RepID=UPI00260939EF|nr:HypC/HybG/HupF family hydrogenase formation chaperone [uncultured Maritimibacter sp.]